LSRKRKYEEEGSNILKDASDSWFSLIFRPFFRLLRCLRCDAKG